MLKFFFNIVIIVLVLLVLHAQQPVAGTLPADAIGYFNRTTATGCSVGWTELTAARGAALVGLPNGGTKGTIVGAPLTDQEARVHNHSLSSHQHSFSGTSGTSTSNVNVSDTGENHDANVPGHAFTFSGNTTVLTTNLTGSASVNVTPYMQLLFCKKS